jgi:iron complex outermembrane receptor protein
MSSAKTVSLKTFNELRKRMGGRRRLALLVPSLSLCVCASAWGGSADAPEPFMPGGDEEPAFPVVITPTRLKQSLADVPASVTVITSDMMRRYGVRSIDDALRWVPGMAVTRALGNDFRINYHGGHLVSPRRMNVQVDGVTVYRPGFSLMDWDALPVALEDIERIEVIRGPDSAAYGPNSMTAVVNVITAHPKDVSKGLLSVAMGGYDSAVDNTARLAGTFGSTSVRATLNTHRDSGFGSGEPKDAARDSSDVLRLNVRAQHEIGPGETLDLAAAYVQAVFQVGKLDYFQTTFPDRRAENAMVSGRWSKALSARHDLQLDLHYAEAHSRQEWTTGWPLFMYRSELVNYFASDRQAIANRIVQALLARRLSTVLGLITSDPGLMAVVTRMSQSQDADSPYLLAPVYGEINSNGSEARTQFELQDTYVFSDALRMVSGLGAREQHASSQTFFDGGSSNWVRWAFAHAEYRPRDWLTFNLGGYAESNTLSGGTFSPRAAVNIKLSEAQAVRAVVSRGSRTPDLFESEGNWSFLATNLSRPVEGSTTAGLAAIAKAPGGLTSEHILSRELGYMFNWRPWGLSFDARVFDDRLTDLISNHLGLYDFAPGNDGKARLSGGELQATWEWARNWSGTVSYGYLRNASDTTAVEASQYSRHSGAVGISHLLADNWRVSLSGLASSGDAPNERGYGRIDMTASHGFKLGERDALAMLGLSYLQTPSVTTVYTSGLLASTVKMDRRLALQAQMRLSF